MKLVAQPSLQPDLFTRTIDQRFAEFNAANPEIYAALVRLARAARNAGKSKIGIAALYERARWDLWIQSETADFKLNNSFRSRYARLIAEQEPDLAGMFEFRCLRAA